MLFYNKRKSGKIQKSRVEILPLLGDNFCFQVETKLLDISVAVQSDVSGQRDQGIGQDNRNH